MKIAVPTNDGVSISRHFGRSASFLFFDVQDNAITAREIRNNSGRHSKHPGEEHDPHGKCCEHGENSHAGVLATLAGSDLVICSGIGDGAAHALQARGVRIVLIEPRAAEDAVASWLNGTLVQTQETGCGCHR